MKKKTSKNDYVTGKHGWHLPPFWDLFVQGWVTGDKKFYRRSVTVHVHTRCFDRSMDRPRENSTNRQIKTKRTHRQSVVRFSMGGETK